MNKLPYWNIPINIPARYDSDSATAIEQTARVYAKMQELIDDYNAFVTLVNNSVADIDKNTHDDIKAFEESITKMMNDFTECINTNVENQNRIIDTLATPKFVYDSINEALNVEGAIVEGV